MMVNYVKFVLALVHSYVTSPGIIEAYSPIVIVPGLGQCALIKENEQIWFNLFELIPTKTIAEKVKFSNDGNIEYSDGKNLEVCENIAHKDDPFYNNYHKLRQILQQKEYYRDKKTMRMVPYDFRKSIYDDLSFQRSLKQIIEEAYQHNSAQPVILIGHSLGGLKVYDALPEMNSTWKKKFIKSIMFVSVPWAGSLEALMTVVSGSNYGIIFRKPEESRLASRSFPSVFQVLPFSNLNENKKPLLRTPERNYSALDYEELFNDISFPEGFKMFQNGTEERNLRAVEDFERFSNAYCIYGAGRRTPTAAQYVKGSVFKKSFPDQQPDLNFDEDNGDGYIELHSLENCPKGTEKVKLQNKPHFGIVADDEFVAMLLK